jgi:hypothetical protein
MNPAVRPESDVRPEFEVRLESEVCPEFAARKRSHRVNWGPAT